MKRERGRWIVIMPDGKHVDVTPKDTRTDHEKFIDRWVDRLLAFDRFVYMIFHPWEWFK